MSKIIQTMAPMDDIAHLLQMFPSISSSVIKTVYESTGGSLENAVDQLMGLQEREDIDIAHRELITMGDEAFAKELQATETENQKNREKTRHIMNNLGINEDEIGFIA